MKKDFETFYNEIDQTEFKKIWEENIIERKKIRKKALKIISILDIGIIVLITLFAREWLVNFVQNFTDMFEITRNVSVIFVLMFIDLMIYVCVSIGAKQPIRYNKEYKEKVIDKLVKNFFDEVDYIPKKEMPEETYKEGKYFGHYDEYHSDDFVSAIIDNKYSMKMGEVTTIRIEEYEDSDGDKHTRRVTVFSGIFAKIHIDKSIKNELRITNNYGVGRNKLEMDSQEFEKYFDVSCTDSIVGMQLLTSDVMNLLVDFRKVFNKDFDIFIKNNTMYVRLHIGSIFEGNVNSKETLDKKELKEYYNDLDFLDTLAKNLIKVVKETEI